MVFDQSLTRSMFNAVWLKYYTHTTRCRVKRFTQFRGFNPSTFQAGDLENRHLQKERSLAFSD
eukprot:3071009-Amphidinium_carterae.1